MPLFKFFLDKVNNNSNNNNNNNNNNKKNYDDPLLNFIARNQILSFLLPKVAIYKTKKH